MGQAARKRPASHAGRVWEGEEDAYVLVPCPPGTKREP